MRDLREASQLGRVARALIVTAALGVAGALALYLALRPPTPLAVPARGVVLRGVHLVNPGEEPLRHRTIRVTGARIDSISAASPDAAEDPYAGSYVLPGLIDLHVHHPIARLGTDIELFGLLHLLHGVTTVRDCGSIDGSILTTRERVASGALAGPRIFACGPLIDGDPPAWPGAEKARSAREAARIADAAAAAGVDCLKAYSNLSDDALAGLREPPSDTASGWWGTCPRRCPSSAPASTRCST